MSCATALLARIDRLQRGPGAIAEMAEMWDGPVLPTIGARLLANVNARATTVLGTGGCKDNAVVCGITFTFGCLFVGNYAAGSDMMPGATWGRIAGTHAAQEALEM